MAGRPRKFDRGAALRTAMELFWEHGYEGTSLTMLTSAMGITPTSLYAAFGSKDALFEEAVTLYNSAASSPMTRLDLSPTRDAIEAMLRRNADAYADTGTPLGCMIVLAATNLGRGHEHVGRLLADLRAQDLAKVTQRIERGIAEGDVPEGVDAPALASYLVTVSQGMALRARDGCTAREAHTVVDAAMTAYDAITAGAGPAI